MKFLHRVFVLLLMSTLVLESEAGLGGIDRRPRRSVCMSRPYPARASMVPCMNRPTHTCYNYNCYPGCVRVTGSTTRTCRNGRWFGTDLVCKGSCCSSPPIPRGTMVESCPSPYTDGAVCTYKCSRFWHIPDSGSTTKTCSNGVWTGTDLVCKLKKEPKPVCSAPPSPANTRKKRCSLRSPPQQSDYCVYECSPGYVQIAGIDFKSCSYGAWKGPDLVCVKSCPSPYTGDAVTKYCRPRAPFPVGARCSFYCSYPLYIPVHGNTTRTCSNDGTWTGTPLFCIRARPCQALTSPTNGAQSPLAPYYFPATVTFTCNPGYVLNGNETTTCRPDGSWSNSTPTCTVGQCSTLTAPTNGALTTFGVIFTCNSGYVRNGAETSTCQAGGTWSNPVPTCTPRPCPGLTAPTNGALSPTGPNYAYPNQVTVTYNSGCDLDGVSPVTCQADGTWSNLVGTCRRYEETTIMPETGETTVMPETDETTTMPKTGCPSPYTSDAVRKYCRPPFRVGARCSFYCRNPWYIPVSGSITRTCSNDGTWTGTLLVCIRAKPCQALTSPTNGAQSPLAPYYIPATVTFTCNPGYVLNGNETTTCRPDGSWSNPTPTCTVGQCSTLTTPTNGALTPVGVIFTCNPGYVRNGAEISTCHGADGSWSNPVPTCTPRPCPGLTAPTNGALSPTGPNYAYPNQVTVTCNSGCDLDGVSPVTCQADGTWSSPVVTCRRNKETTIMPETGVTTKHG
ncbi:P-selectin-like [Branchiostoma floridae x Branchiostoma japonicum]